MEYLFNEKIGEESIDSLSHVFDKNENITGEENEINIKNNLVPLYRTKEDGITWKSNGLQLTNDGWVLLSSGFLPNRRDKQWEGNKLKINYDNGLNIGSLNIHDIPDFYGKLNNGGIIGDINGKYYLIDERYGLIDNYISICKLMKLDKPKTLSYKFRKKFGNEDENINSFYIDEENFLLTKYGNYYSKNKNRIKDYDMHIINMNYSKISSVLTNNIGEIIGINTGLNLYKNKEESEILSNVLLSVGSNRIERLINAAVSELKEMNFKSYGYK